MKILLVIPIFLFLFLIWAIVFNIVASTGVDEDKASRWPILLFTVVPISFLKWVKRVIVASWQDIKDVW